MSQDKKYQVFISSTYTDLVEAREKVTKVILDLYHLPVGMEMFSADDDDQWKIITDAIDLSDYYVLILGHRYGSLTNKGISYTEKEFNYAKLKNIPILSFIRHRDTAVSNTHRESNQKSIGKLEKFIAKASKGKMCAFWTDVSDLERQLAIALPKSFARHQGVGWIRGDSKSEHVAEEIAKLSEENRKLREENERIKESIKVKQPLLKVNINDIASTSIEEFDEIQLFWLKLREDEYYEKPKKISNLMETRRSGDLFTTATFYGLHDIKKYIQEYNDEVDSISEKAINNHNKALRELYQIEVRALQLHIAVENFGNNLANILSIEIEFPKFITIIDDQSDANIESFQRNIEKRLIPEIKSPETRQQEYMSGLNRFNPIDYRNLPANVGVIGTYTEENTIYIKSNSLLHSRKMKFENYYLVPNMIDEGVVKINIMCAEYTEPVYLEIPIVVTQ